MYGTGAFKEKEMQYMERLRWLDAKKFWRFVRNKPLSIAIAGVRVAGRVCTEPDTVRKEVHKFFAELYKKKEGVGEKWEEWRKWWPKKEMPDKMLSEKVTHTTQATSVSSAKRVGTVIGQTVV